MAAVDIGFYISYSCLYFKINIMDSKNKTFLRKKDDYRFWEIGKHPVTGFQRLSAKTYRDRNKVNRDV
tara:strand:+ start:680 stop:883 length:204 start_codon:yes stop_codon:yes gene_type:complete